MSNTAYTTEDKFTTREEALRHFRHLCTDPTIIFVGATGPDLVATMTIL